MRREFKTEVYKLRLFRTIHYQNEITRLNRNDLDTKIYKQKVYKMDSCVIEKKGFELRQICMNLSKWTQATSKKRVTSRRKLPNRQLKFTYTMSVVTKVYEQNRARDRNKFKCLWNKGLWALRICANGD